MARESVGHIKLVWNCPACGTQNPGPYKFCTACGAPQPQNVLFEVPAQQELIKDDEEIAKAKAGPDVHCAFCGTRNAGDAKFCSQCGADLVEGKQRETGRIVGAFQAEPAGNVICPSCGAANSASSLTCTQCGSSLKSQPEKPAPAPSEPRPKTKVSPLIIVSILFIFMLLCGLIFWAFTRKESTSGVVTDVHWTRAIVIEEFGAVVKEDWLENIPSSAEILSCEKRFHHEQDTAIADSEKVCGTEYIVDDGSGYGEVVRDCVYRVYLDYCDYQVDDWQIGNTVTLEGSDLMPVWPSPSLDSTQRFGEYQEEYTVLFNSEGQIFTYTTSDEDIFTECQIGSEWVLNINPTFNSVISIEAAQ